MGRIGLPTPSTSPWILLFCTFFQMRSTKPRDSLSDTELWRTTCIKTRSQRIRLFQRREMSTQISASTQLGRQRYFMSSRPVQAIPAAPCLSGQYTVSQPCSSWALQPYWPRYFSTLPWDPIRSHLQTKQRIPVRLLLPERSGVYSIGHPHQYPSSRSSCEANKMTAIHWWETEVSFLLQEPIFLKSRWFGNSPFFPSRSHTCLPNSQFPKSFAWLCLPAVLFCILVAMDLSDAMVFKYLELITSAALSITARRKRSPAREIKTELHF